ETFEDVKGPIDAVGYGLERFGEFIPQLGTYLTGAGIGGAGARMLARKASKDFSEELLSKGVAPGLLSKETADAAIAGRLANIAAAGQAGSQAATSGLAFTQLAPETFRNVYEETGKLEPGISSLYGGIGMLIERIVPDRIKDTLGNFGKVKIAENAAKLSGRMEAAKILAKEAAIVSQMEGLTEAAQGIISNAAAKYVDDNIQLFSDKRIKDYLEQYFSGAASGGGAGVISKIPEAISAKRQIEEAQKPVAPQAETQPPQPPPSPSPPQLIPPRGGITLAEPQKPLITQAVTPTTSSETPAPGGGLQNLATVGSGLVDAMYDQLFKAHKQGTTTIAGNTEYILEVANERGKTFNTPDEIKAFVQEPGVNDRVQQLAQEDRVRRLAKAGKTPDEIKKMVPQGIDVDTILGIQKPPSGISIPVPPSETIQLATTPVEPIEEGPPEFVEPPPE
ncbi:MAG: hypothetical protein EB101_11815, partial [Chitinophagia bacterium]|nr:hypothetical protein [Chitinophagia bacterium]